MGKCTMCEISQDLINDLQLRLKSMRRHNAELTVEILELKKIKEAAFECHTHWEMTEGSVIAGPHMMYLGTLLAEYDKFNPA